MDHGTLANGASGNAASELLDRCGGDRLNIACTGSDAHHPEVTTRDFLTHGNRSRCHEYFEAAIE